MSCLNEFGNPTSSESKENPIRVKNIICSRCEKLILPGVEVYCCEKCKVAICGWCHELDPVPKRTIGMCSSFAEYKRFCCNWSKSKLAEKRDRRSYS